MAVCLIRKNVTQDFASAIFEVSQAAVSWRWTPCPLLRPLITQVLAASVLDLPSVLGRESITGGRHGLPHLRLGRCVRAVLGARPATRE